MIIRRAIPQDMDGITDLLGQVASVHHAGRPDLFRDNTIKYTSSQLATIIADDTRPIFVAVGEDAPDAPAHGIFGYAFCIFESHEDNNVLTNIKTLYIDDLCVDKNVRGTHVGTKLYDHVMAFARENGCYNVTLNVWALNDGARAFYDRMGMKPQKYGLEAIL